MANLATEENAAIIAKNVSDSLVGSNAGVAAALSSFQAESVGLLQQILAVLQQIQVNTAPKK